jgi:DNA polymerase-4
VSATLLYAVVPRFYAEVERVAHPELADRPIVVGGDPRKRGTVHAASEDALARGVEVGMPVLEALERCPRARALPTDMRRYREVSAQLRAGFRRVTERVEPAGLDAAYLDLGAIEACPCSRASRRSSSWRAWPPRRPGPRASGGCGEAS